ncbi:MAG TPA: hypothetical protein VK978_00495 [Candidatus Saccharimonadales bacterium]|nr:hypothetical protein [Candidatus Saccharimonadales bacterium]
MKISHVRATASTASVLSCLFLAVGTVGATGSSISNTGVDSTNVVSSTANCNTEVLNQSDVEIRNNNLQDAQSGDADSRKNTEAGRTGSGNATNNSGANFEVDIANTSPAISCAQNQANQQEQPANQQEQTIQAVASTERPNANRGAGQPAPAAAPKEQPRQVQQTPTGSVAAGAGSVGVLGSLVALSLASGAWAMARVRTARSLQ